jgi:hypothetical protein
MTAENENAYTPEVEDPAEIDDATEVDDEKPFPVHPFTQDEPVTGYPVQDEPVTAGTLPPETGEGTRVPGGEPRNVNVAELGPLFEGSQASDFQQQWQQIQSSFVEDPQNAVQQAEGLTDEILGSLTRALEDRRRTLDDSARNGDTEQLRLVLRQYREVLQSVTSL